MTNTPTFIHFNLVHQIKRRIRVIAPCIQKDPERAYILQILLLKRDAIEDVKVVPAIGSVTIRFDPDSLPKSALLKLLEAVLSNIGNKPKQTIEGLHRTRIDPSLPMQDLVFAIGGMSCASCALYLEMVLQRDPDIATAKVNFINETAYVRGHINKPAVFDIITSHGYQAFPLDTLTERKMLLKREHRHIATARNRFLSTAFFGFPLALLGMLPRKSFSVQLLQGLLASPIILLGGYDIFKKAAVLAKQRNANMDSLIALGAGSAYGFSVAAIFTRSKHVYFESAAGIILFVLLGRYLEEIAKGKVLQDINALVSVQPQEAVVINEGIERKVDIDSVTVGDILLIRPGEKIPADGIVIKGLSAVDESKITGSSKPCVKESGHKLFDGSINGSGVLHMRATAIGTETVLSGLIHLIDEAQASGLPVQKTVDHIATIFVPAILALSATTFSGWLLAGERVAHALSNAIAVLLIACPCSLGLATPAATMVGTGQAARRGIYIRNSESLEATAAISVIVFDKTGTLTEGKAKICDFLNISSFDDDVLLQLAASAEFESEHFLAKAIVDHAESLSINRLEASQFMRFPDQGIRSHVDGHNLLLGSESWLNQNDVDISALAASAKRFAQHGKILVFMAVDEQAAALFAFTDELRAGALQVITHLHELNIKTQLVTGDTKASATRIAQTLGLDTVTAEADPKRKLAIIKALQKQGNQVAMIGDGINDAPALAAANVGMAIDSGSGLAIEAADLVLVNGDIAKVSDAIELSQNTLAIIKQNLLWAFSYNAIAIPLAALGKLNPLIASASMSLSSVSVIANSLRLNKK